MTRKQLRVLAIAAGAGLVVSVTSELAGRLSQTASFSAKLQAMHDGIKEGALAVSDHNDGAFEVAQKTGRQFGDG